MGHPHDKNGCFVALFLFETIRSCSMFSVLALALHRFRAVFFPVFHAQNTHQIPTYPILASVIVGASVSSLPMLRVSGMYNECWNGQECLYVEVLTNKFVFIAFIFEFFLTTLIILLAYGMIMVHLFKRKNPSNRSRVRDEQMRIALTIVITLGIFLIMKLPIWSINAYNFFCDRCFKKIDWINLAIFISHITSVIHPFLYAFRIKELRETFKEIFRLRRNFIN